MDQQVLEQLDRIERAAEKILSDANGRKSQLLKANDERIAAFDQKIDAKASAQIEALRRDIDASHQAETERMSRGTKQVLDRLESEYRSKKETIAARIVEKILK